LKGSRNPPAALTCGHFLSSGGTRAGRHSETLDYPTLGKRFLLHCTGGTPDFYELGEPAKPFGPAAPPKER
jgi:hypothetical protein